MPRKRSFESQLERDLKHELRLKIDKKYYFTGDRHPDGFNEYEPYWCLVCGIREDEEDLTDYDGCGVVIPSKYGEIYLCHKCRKVFKSLM